MPDQVTLVQFCVFSTQKQSQNRFGSRNEALYPITLRYIDETMSVKSGKFYVLKAYYTAEILYEFSDWCSLFFRCRKP